MTTAALAPLVSDSATIFRFIQLKRWPGNIRNDGSFGGRARGVVPLRLEEPPMNYPMRAVLAIVLGAGLAASAQAQDTYKQSAAPNSQSAAPTDNMQMQKAAPAALMAIPPSGWVS